MLRFLGKTTASAAASGGSSAGEVDEGLSVWELVNAAQSDDEDLYSYDSDGVISGSCGASDVEPESDQEESVGADAVISIEALSFSPPTAFPVEMAFNYARRDCAEVYDDDVLRDLDDDDDDDDDDDQYDYDVDDELVPWKLKDRYGKQRIQKIGKKGGPKFKKAKQLPYYNNRPGCPYGKFRGH